MNKRWIAAFMMIVMIIGIFCGCKKKEAVETTAPAEETGLTASLTLVCPVQGAALDEIGAQLADFKARFPNVDVMLVTDADAQGDVVLTTPDDAYNYYKEGKLLDLNMWVNDSGLVLDRLGNMSQMGLPQETQENLVELFYEEGTQFEDNTLYMMPFYRHSQILFMNQTFMEEHELETPFTWEELEVVCETAKAADPEFIPLVFNDITSTFISMCAQFGAEYNKDEGIVSLLNSEGAVKALKMLNDWYAKGYMTTAELRGGQASLTAEDAWLIIDSTANSKNHAPAADNDAFAFEMSGITLPYFAEGTGKVLTEGPGFVLVRSEDDDQNLAAWLLIKHLTVDEAFQTKLAMAGSVIPVLSSIITNDTYSDYLDLANGDENVDSYAALVSMEQQHRFFTAPAYDGSAADKTVIAELISTCIILTGDVEGQIVGALEAAIS